MRLFSKNEDTTLSIVLIFSAFIVFQRPLRFVLDVAHDVETRYGLDLIPALTVLVFVFAFHEYQKRQRSRSGELRLQAEVGRERARSDGLERCIRFAQLLADSHDETSLEQALWQHLPHFARGEAWLLTHKRDKWQLVFQNGQSDQRRSLEELEEASRNTLASARFDGLGPVQEGDETRFPLIVGGTVVGVLGVRRASRLSATEREALLMAAALVALTIKNIQQLHEITEEGVRDSLTGCYNRRHGLDRLSGELRRARRSGRAVSVLMLDLDEFKGINDSHGHIVGDQVLAKVGAQLVHSLRSTDIPCRYGGDEFLVVLPDTPGQGAEHVAACLRRALASLTLDLDGKPGTITASIGTAGAMTGETSAEDLIARADRDLFVAKAAKKKSASAPVALEARAAAS